MPTQIARFRGRRPPQSAPAPAAAPAQTQRTRTTRASPPRLLQRTHGSARKPSRCNTSAVKNIPGAMAPNASRYPSMRSEKLRRQIDIFPRPQAGRRIAHEIKVHPVEITPCRHRPEPADEKAIQCRPKCMRCHPGNLARPEEKYTYAHQANGVTLARTSSEMKNRELPRV